MWKSITWLFTTSLRNQIMATVGLYALIVMGYFALQHNPDFWMKTAAIILGFIAFGSAANSYKKHEREMESKMSQSQIIARGVSRGRSPAAHDLGELIGMLIWAAGFFITYLLYMSLSLLIAPTMTAIIAYKLIVKKEQI